MSDAYPAAVAPAAVVEPLALTEAEQAEVDALYALLEPQALAEARKFVLARTPVPYQEAMMAKVDADYPPPEPPPEA